MDWHINRKTLQIYNNFVSVFLLFLTMLIFSPNALTATPSPAAPALPAALSYILSRVHAQRSASDTLINSPSNPNAAV